MLDGENCNPTKIRVIKGLYLWYTRSKLVYHGVPLIIGGLVVYHKIERES